MKSLKAFILSFFFILFISILFSAPVGKIEGKKVGIETKNIITKVNNLNISGKEVKDLKVNDVTDYFRNNSLKISSAKDITTFAWAYRGDESDRINSISPTSDGGYIMAGYNSINNCDYVVIKLDSEGNVLWAKTYGGSLQEAYPYIVPTNDGGYIVAGSTTSFGAGRADFLAIKLDSEGNVLWAKTYGGTEYEEPKSISFTDDGGCIIAGVTESFKIDGENEDALVIKLNSNGDVMWTKVYGKYPEIHAFSIYSTSDGGYIVAGSYTVSYSNPLDVFLVLKLDPNGNIIWAKTFGGEKWYSLAYSTFPTSDGGYIVAGLTDSFNNKEGYALLVIKLDSSGNVSWDKLYRGNGDAHTYSICPTADGGYIIPGFSSNHIQDTYFIIKLDSNGNVSWAKTQAIYSDETEGLLFSGSLTDDGGNVVAGYLGIRLLDFFILDPIVLKFDPDGNIDGENCFLQSFNPEVTTPTLSVSDITNSLRTKNPDISVEDVTSSIVSSSFYLSQHTPYCGKLGDINGDGSVDETDAVSLAYSLSEDEITPNTGDLNGDNKVDIVDLLLLLISLANQ